MFWFSNIKKHRPTFNFLLNGDILRLRVIPAQDWPTTADKWSSKDLAHWGLRQSLCWAGPDTCELVHSKGWSKAPPQEQNWWNLIFGEWKPIGIRKLRMGVTQDSLFERLVCVFVSVFKCSVRCTYTLKEIYAGVQVLHMRLRRSNYYFRVKFIFTSV